MARRCLGLDVIGVEVPYVAQVGNIVLTERIDHLLRRNGIVIASAAVAGTFEFDGDGGLVAWREHFDVVGFAGQIVLGTISRRRRVQATYDGV